MVGRMSSVPQKYWINTLNGWLGKTSQPLRSCASCSTLGYTSMSSPVYHRAKTLVIFPSSLLRQPCHLQPHLSPRDHETPLVCKVRSIRYSAAQKTSSPSSPE